MIQFQSAVLIVAEVNCPTWDSKTKTTQHTEWWKKTTMTYPSIGAGFSANMLQQAPSKNAR